MSIRGIAYPFRREALSFPATVEGDRVVMDNVRRIIETRRGTRVMRRSLGSDVWLFVFENIGPVMLARLDHEVRRAISEGEPRATVLSVTARQNASSDGTMNETVVFVDIEVNGRRRRVEARFGEGAA